MNIDERIELVRIRDKLYKTIRSNYYCINEEIRLQLEETVKELDVCFRS